ncbi:conserved protein of unknown function [Petrocella atlantisensis]|uniref:Uncharacterized protein n=1 Tax=Petrocella atlantisensis TaxID=2173034 RepID=A0A3P7PSJ2_9FIRM|nr:hypothetical protein [Petrocella atlantisensis]VDN47057.1 conserved protein of unknown function [Petrocella atlantisensis]
MSIDSLKVREFAYMLSKANDVDGIVTAWLCVKEHFENLKAIVSLENYPKKFLDEEIRNKLDCRNSGFVSYFESSNLYFVSNESMIHMFDTGNVDFKIDYSIMFDTNFASYIHEFVKTGKVNVTLNNVFKTIDFLLRNELRYDYNFYLIENSKYFENKEFEPFSQSDIFNNIVSLELFKSINRNVYCELGRIEYTISYHEAEAQAKFILNSMYKTDDGQAFCSFYRNIQRQNLLNLIGMININFSSKLGARRKMEQYFDYITNVLGIYMDREAVIAHKLFNKNKDVNIFKRIHPNMKTEKLLSILNNIAWDFTIPRTMETIMTTCGEGDYFVPIFLSFDKDLRSLINLFPIKGCIFNPGNMQVIPVPKNISGEYFEANGCKEQLDNLMKPDVREKRFKVCHDNQRNNYEIITSEYKKIEFLLCKEQS